MSTPTKQNSWRNKGKGSTQRLRVLQINDRKQARRAFTEVMILAYLTKCCEGISRHRNIGANNQIVTNSIQISTLQIGHEIRTLSQLKQNADAELIEKGGTEKKTRNRQEELRQIERSKRCGFSTNARSSFDCQTSKSCVH